MSAISVIVINPYQRSVGALDIEPTQDAVRNVIFDGAPWGKPDLIERVQLGRSLAMYIDESGLMRDWSKQRFFRFDDGGYNFAGISVIVREEMFMTEDGPDIRYLSPFSGSDKDMELLVLTEASVTWVDEHDVEVHEQGKLTAINADGTTTVLHPGRTLNYANCAKKEGGNG